MSRSLTQAIIDQETRQSIKGECTFEIESVDRSDYLLSWDISTNVSFGSQSGVFRLHNPSGVFSSGGSYEIKIGDTIELIEKYGGDATQFKKFYGIVNQRSVDKKPQEQTITLNCLDYISVLQDWTINLKVEGTTVKVTDEVLSPVYLAAPNDNMAQLFNFANDAIANKPLPIVKIKDKTHNFTDPQPDGFQILYRDGQLKLGCPLQVRHNYEVKCSYFYYTKGVYAEDILEDILTIEDGYGNFLFGETSAANVITNHLTTTFNAEEGTNTDTLVINAAAITLTIEHLLASDVVIGATSITLDSVSGLPNNGEGSINGDIFTWSSISSVTLQGVPATGSYALKAHNSGDYVEYEHEYAVGKICYMSYSNITTTLTTSDFTIPGGVTVDHHCKRGTQDGSYIILNSAISPTEIVTCNTNYSFKTLQASDIELNTIHFEEREERNALEAIKKVRSYLPPNFVIRTQGDNKIWGSYLKQKSTADYDLELVTGISYLEDQDLYTRVIMYGKNENPTNIMFEDNVAFTEGTETYYGTVTKESLYFIGEEKSGVLSEEAQSDYGSLDYHKLIGDQTLIDSLLKAFIYKDYANQASTGYYIYTTVMSNRGKIILEDVVPTIYINNIPIDNKVHQMVAVPIKLKTREETTTSGNTKSKSVSVHSYYYYTAIFPHTSIVPNEPIYIYDSQGLLIYTISANDPDMDYANGVFTVPGNEQNTTAENASTATYWILYSTDKILIDYDNIVFKIHKSILPKPTESVVKATFEYWDIITPVRDIDAIVDGRRDTQLQLIFFGEPTSGFVLGTIDLGETKTIQAIDIMPGYFKPDEDRKYDMGCRMSLQYSTDNVNYYDISKTTDNFELRTGGGITFEEDDLGSNFQARYIKVLLQSVDKIEYGRGVYVVSIAEVAMYDNIILKSESKLIPTTTLTQDVNPGDTTVHITSSDNFSSSGTGYLDKDSNKPFTYSGLTSTTFTGCTVGAGITASSGEYTTQTIVTDTSLYDNDNLLPELGDRVYKEMRISDRNLYSQSELDDLTKAYLEEFYKNHSKLQVNLVYAPYILMGQTVRLIDSLNNVDEKNFVEAIHDKGGSLSLTLAHYPA